MIRNFLIPTLSLGILCSCQNYTYEILEDDSIEEVNYSEKIDSLEAYISALELAKISANDDQKPIEIIDSIEGILTKKIELLVLFKRQAAGMFPLSKQTEKNNCGPTCLKMISDYYGVYRELSFYEELAKLDTNGTSIDNLANAGKALNFKTHKHLITYEELLKLKSFPLIVYWNKKHFIIVYNANEHQVWVADPILGEVEYSKTEFCEYWVQMDGPTTGYGKAITLVPNKVYQ